MLSPTKLANRPKIHSAQNYLARIGYFGVIDDDGWAVPPDSQKALKRGRHCRPSPLAAVGRRQSPVPK